MVICVCMLCYGPVLRTYISISHVIYAMELHIWICVFNCCICLVFDNDRWARIYLFSVQTRDISRFTLEDFRAVFS